MSEENLNEELELEENTEVSEKTEAQEAKEEVEEVSELDKIKDAYQRLQADFANYKRRQEAERINIYKYASESVVTKLLNVVDNFDRALNGVEEDNTFIQGIKMIKSELDSILSSEGVEEIKSDGEKFDANLHHAVFMEENPEVEVDHVIETFQKGYRLKDKVIRPAMVKVSK